MATLSRVNGWTDVTNHFLLYLLLSGKVPMKIKKIKKFKNFPIQTVSSCGLKFDGVKSTMEIENVKR